MPGKSEWKRLQRHEGPETALVVGVELEDFKQRWVTGIDGLDEVDLTAPLESTAGEPVSPTDVDSIPTPLIYSESKVISGNGLWFRVLASVIASIALHVLALKTGTPLTGGFLILAFIVLIPSFRWIAKA